MSVIVLLSVCGCFIVGFFLVSCCFIVVYVWFLLVFGLVSYCFSLFPTSRIGFFLLSACSCWFRIVLLTLYYCALISFCFCCVRIA